MYSELLKPLEKPQESEFKDGWNDVMKTEYNSLIENGVWKLVDRPKDKIIGKCKWIYELKNDPDGDIKNIKCKLLQRDLANKIGVDYKRPSYQLCIIKKFGRFFHRYR